MIQFEILQGVAIITTIANVKVVLFQRNY